jgi:hypothetical protein
MKKAALLLSMLMLSLLFSLPFARSQETQDLIPDLAAELNLWRLELGLGPLVYDPTLESMAISQADYLMSLADMPLGGDMHTDAQGGDARARSQRDPFNWPTYGHPEFISLTEIAGVGSIRSALQFWHGSPLHERSVTNPNYREVGIAVRDMGNLNGDALFIVVLGGRPDVLTALADPEANSLYLTTETNAWTGDWIGTVTEYRFLDSDHQPVGDWLEWELIVPLPTDMGEEFYVEYRDADEHSVEAPVIIPARWSSFDTGEPEEDAEVAADSTRPAGGGLVFATNTPFGAPTSQPSATPTLPLPTSTPEPEPSNVLLLYNARLFTLVPLGDFVDVSEMTFRNGSLDFEVADWEAVGDDINLSALPANNCLQIWQRDAGEFTAPAQCGYVRSVIFMAQNNIFWSQGSFEVLVNDEPVATCQADDGQCSVALR